LIFYSSRAGFDEPPEVEFDENPEPEASPETEPPARRPRKTDGRRDDEHVRDKVTRIDA
jgi:hypothetical protein